MKMKMIQYNIQILLLLVLFGVSVFSCVPEPENAAVTFMAVLGGEKDALAFSDELTVNTLVVAVYDASEAKSHLFTQEFSITPGATSIPVTLSLAVGQTYNIIFWAYNPCDNHYFFKDLKEITMLKAADAFFATKKNFDVNANSTCAVSLKRPLAQINVGTPVNTEIDYSQVEFTINNACKTFHPFEETVSEEQKFTWTFNKIAETFTVDGTPYTYLATGYVFAPIVQSSEYQCQLVLRNENGNEIYRKDNIQIMLQANMRSNIIIETF